MLGAYIQLCTHLLTPPQNKDVQVCCLNFYHIPLLLSRFLASKSGLISVTSAHSKKGRFVREFEGYSERAENGMYKQMIKVLKLHYHKHPHNLSAAMQVMAYNG